MTKHKFDVEGAVDAQKKSIEPRKRNQQRVLENQQRQLERTDTLESLILKVLSTTANILKTSEETRKMLEVMSGIDRRIHPSSEEIFGK